MLSYFHDINNDKQVKAKRAYW